MTQQFTREVTEDHLIPRQQLINNNTPYCVWQWLTMSQQPLPLASAHATDCSADDVLSKLC